MLKLLNHYLARSNGFIYAVAAVFILAVTDNIVIFFSESLSVWQVLFMRGAVLLPIFLLLIFTNKIQLKADCWFYVLLRSFILSFAVVFFYISISVMDIAIAGAGLFTHPVFLWLMSFIFLSATVNWGTLLALMLGLIGAWLIIDPHSAEFHWINLFAIFSGALYALNSLVVKHCCQEESAALLMIFYILISALMGLCGLVVLQNLSLEPQLISQYSFMLSGWKTIEIGHFMWIFLQGALVSIAVIWLTKAYQMTDIPSNIAVIEYFYLVFAGTIAYILFDQKINVQGFLGMACICFSGLIILFHKKISSRRNR